jgi:hypothetical protein
LQSDFVNSFLNFFWIESGCKSIEKRRHRRGVLAGQASALSFVRRLACLPVVVSSV